MWWVGLPLDEAATRTEMAKDPARRPSVASFLNPRKLKCSTGHCEGAVRSQMERTAEPSPHFDLFLEVLQ